MIEYKSTLLICSGGAEDIVLILFWSKMILVTDFAVTVVQIKKTLTKKRCKYDAVYDPGV